jgi:hypothetical protein
VEERNSEDPLGALEQKKDYRGGAEYGKTEERTNVRENGEEFRILFIGFYLEFVNEGLLPLT